MFAATRKKCSSTTESLSLQELFFQGEQKKSSYKFTFQHFQIAFNNHPVAEYSEENVFFKFLPSFQVYYLVYFLLSLFL
jgi:hypothetical protein